ncbi:MAG: polyprenyl synthetase family protein [Candidatus Diapherotrites archaeon]
MLDKNYFKVMSETSSEVDKVTSPYLNKIVDIARVLPEARLGRPRLRDMLVRLGYEISGGNNWKDVIPVCASYEFLNCSSYVINWIFDEKGEEKSKGDKDNLIIGGFQLREIAEELLKQDGLEEIVGSLSTINKAIYNGQNLDLNILKLSDIEKFSSYEDFIKHYEMRCHGLSGEFYGQCLLNGSRASGNEDLKLYKIGKILGTGLQASNDLGDFALPKSSISVCEKPYKDQLSDLRQGKLTLPVYLLATKLKIDESKLRKMAPDKVLKLLHSTGTFKECINYLRDQKRKARKELYNNFEKNGGRNLLASALVAISSNKFIISMKKPR